MTRFKAGLRPHPATEIVAGPDGNLWFTYDAGIRSSAGGGIGRVTLGGAITLFPEPPDQHGSPFEIVAGQTATSGSTTPRSSPPPGRRSVGSRPSGEITQFSPGLRESAAVANLTPGPGGIWFADTSSTPGDRPDHPERRDHRVPRPTPGRIPAALRPHPRSQGNLWFGANNRTPSPVERITPAGTIEAFSAGLDPRAEGVGPFVVGSDGKAWFGVEKRPPRGRPGSEAGLTAIGRISPAGEIGEFSDCLRPMPGYARPNFLTLGPDANVWFTTWPSGETGAPNRASTPSIGHVTPAEGAQLHPGAGCHPQPARILGRRRPALVTERNRIDRHDLGSAPAGGLPTPSSSSPLHAARERGTQIPVVVPGPGKLSDSAGSDAGARPSARRCGPTTLSLSVRGGRTPQVVHHPLPSRPNCSARQQLSALTERTTVVLRSRQG